MSDQLTIETTVTKSGLVECLGLHFEGDEARRTYFSEKLRAQLQDPEFRKIDGFPTGADEDILRLSNPPYYTACPNPFLEDFIRCYGVPYDPTTSYERKPLAADVSEGKNDPIYNAHSYHTKVPHKAIMRYILHYTEPGDIVLDAFCGTGMAGVAAQLCGSAEEVRSLGYRLLPDGTVLDETDSPVSRLGPRRAVLSDLSPAATFIASNYNLPTDDAFFHEGQELLSDFEKEWGWMYETSGEGVGAARIEYTVWSEVFACPNCSGEVVYFDVAVSKKDFEVMDAFRCPHCETELDKRSLIRCWQSGFDPALGRPHPLVKYRPVLIVYEQGGIRRNKKPDEADLELLNRIEHSAVSTWFPSTEMLEGERKGKDGYHLKGITNLHHFYFRRPLLAFSSLWEKAQSLSAFSRFFVQGSSLGFTKMNRYSANHFSQVNRFFSGTLFVPSLISEVSPRYSMSHKLRRLTKLRMPGHYGLSMLNCGSTTKLAAMPSNSADYVFVDPPFGNNLHYSELNFLWESWLKLMTNRTLEAVMDVELDRSLLDYQKLMTASFREIYRVLKPGRWMTVEFHNSRNSVWNAIQLAMGEAGFIIADVRTLDKQQQTYKQSIQNLVKQDLVISAYKPNADLEVRFQLEAGTEDGAWDFVRNHLRQLPVFVSQKGKGEAIAERQAFLLFDRMVAFHVQRGIMVPLSAGGFYEGLAQLFEYRDGMYFLADQVDEYDKKKQTVSELRQLELIVRDEFSAVQWLRQQLAEKPQRFSELQPQFMRETAGWSKEEQRLELSEILRLSFLCYGGEGEVPVQIRNYLSKNFHDLRGLAKDAPALQAKANDRWYVPDPNKAVDLEKIRERELLKTFEEYRASGVKKIKVPRLEALRAGFKRAWDQRDYTTIVEVAAKVPESILQEDTKLLMFYDLAATRLGVG